MRLRLAIADDEPEILADLHETLEGLGHKVVCAAENGRLLLEKLEDQPVDLVISDVRMPELDGRELAHRLHSRVPVLALSAFLEPTNNTFQAVVKKPYTDESLRLGIERALAKFNRNGRCAFHPTRD